MTDGRKSQADKFKEAAKAAEYNPDEKRWGERFKKVARAKPAPEKPK